MVSVTDSVSRIKDQEDSHKENIAKDSAEKKPASAAVIACVLLIPSDCEPVIAILQKLTANTTAPAPANATGTAQSLELEGSWLDHNTAAEYLGISKSTLYRYAEQERIESCKFGGRLEYRRSSLDKFKDQHVRPARRSHRGGGIITSALSSGK